MDATYIDEKSFAERYLVSRKTAQRWRIAGEGPPYVRLGARRIAYRLADCERWAEAQTIPGCGKEPTPAAASGAQA
jgi:predicted DNA-binding transcriptional regulator AlpA